VSFIPTLNQGDHVHEHLEMGKDPSLDGCVQDGREEKDGAVVYTVAWTLLGLSQINNDIVGLLPG